MAKLSPKKIHISHNSNRDCELLVRYHLIEVNYTPAESKQQLFYGIAFSAPWDRKYGTKNSACQLKNLKYPQKTGTASNVYPVQSRRQFI